MRPLGYVLLGLNLLASVGFVYLGMQDFYGEKGKGNGRQNITAAGVRHLLKLRGLPIDGGPDKLPNRVSDPSADGYSAYIATEVPFRTELAGGRMTETVSPELLYVYFTPVAQGKSAVAAKIGGNVPVTSQVNEAKRVRDILRGMVNEAADKVALLRDLLLLQAESYDERAEIQELVRTGKAEELDSRLFARFDQVINPTNARQDATAAQPTPEEVEAAKAPSGTTTEDREAAATKARAKLDERLKAGAELRAGTSKDEAERRAHIAHLLIHLDRDQDWQRRVALVVGLREYVRAVAAQAARFATMAGRVDRQILADQDAFQSLYDRLEALARERTLMGRDMEETRRKLTDQETRDRDFVNTRITELNRQRQQLAAVKAEVNALLARQETTERFLFEIQREVGVTLDLIYRLEADLDRREHELLKR
jgi:hypothetical protein